MISDIRNRILGDRASGWREAIRVVALSALMLLFIFQAQLVVGHLHVSLITAFQANAVSGNSPQNAPDNPSHMHCALCLQLASAHSYLANHYAPAVVVSWSRGEDIEVVFATHDVLTQGFIWRSRAPPII